MNRQLVMKLIVVALFGLAIAIGYVKFGGLLSLDYLTTEEASLREYGQQHPYLIYVVSFLIYAVVTGLSIPGATVLTLLYAWFFGLVWGVILVSFASTTGATIAFWLSRYLFRGAIQRRFGVRLEQFNDALEREGPFFLFTLRLIPVIPFFVINVVMGLTPLKTSTYWFVSQVGMLPATMVYVYAGAAVPTLAELAERGTSGVLSVQVLVALALLGLFPFLACFLSARFTSLKNT